MSPPGSRSSSKGAISPPLQLWGFHRALTGLLREVHSASTLAGEMPFVGLAVLFNPNRYEDELRSIRLWFSMTLGLTRRVLETGRCQTG